MKTALRFLGAALFAFAGLALLLWGGFLPAELLSQYGEFSQTCLLALGWVSENIAPPLWQLLVAAGVVWAMVSLVLCIRKKKFLRWLANLAMTAGVLLFLFSALWGLGHHLPTKTEQLVKTEPVSAEDLADATAYFAKELSALAPQIERDERGFADTEDFSRIAEKAEDACADLQRRYPQVFPYAAELKVKKLLLSDLFGYLGITGIFVPVTAEASVSGHTYPSSLPFTACHELGHRLGACAEEDANFVAFLACVEQEDVLLRYSAHYSAFLYCYNSLYRADREKALAVWQTLSPPAQQDVRAATKHYAPYEGKVQEAADSFNDLYLKTAGQDAGVQSYGLVSDGLVAWYRENQKS